MTDSSELTQILRKAAEGSQEAYKKLFPVVYEQLKKIARMRISKEHDSITLTKTGLVHEAYFRLVNIEDTDWKDRSHFFAVASRCMRRILIDHARKKKAEKRGGEQKPVTYVDELIKVEDQAESLINLDDALNQLEQLNERMSKVVECRYFGEMSIEETAEALDISVSTVKRDWAKARGWLYKELKGNFG